MKNYFQYSLLCLFCCCIQSLSAQLPDTEIFLAKITKSSGMWKFSEAENITNRVGYDNQPSFSPDNKKILFVRVEDTTQSDIVEYSIGDKSLRHITSSPESEYSPAFNSNTSKVSVVRVDQDSAQRFYIFEYTNPSDIKFVEGTDSIGYYCWLNDSLLAMFLVGEKFSLQVLNINTSKRTFISYNIGRCLKLSADKSSLLYVDKSDSTQWYINNLSISDFEKTVITKVIPGNEDFAPLPDGSLVMGSEGNLYLWNELTKKDWVLIMNYQNTVGPFYRITINDDGTMIAFVAYAGKKP